MNSWFKNKWLWVSVILFLLIGLFLLLQKPANPWKSATVAYDPECREGCEELGSVSLTHLGNVTVYVQPKVDDAIAQWGDCLDSVTQCVENRDLTRDNIVTCVGVSICPSECKTVFSKKTQNTTQVDEIFDAFEQVFINDNAVCLPGESNR